MDMQLIRHRATRDGAFGTLSIGEFECITLENRRDMLDEGRHEVRIEPSGVVIGDHVVADHAVDNGIGGAVVLGLTAGRRSVRETSEAVALLTSIVRDIFNRDQSVELEVIDLIDYAKTDAEVF